MSLAVTEGHRSALSITRISFGKAPWRIHRLTFGTRKCRQQVIRYETGEGR